jgi:hypothetical protein
MPDEVTKRITAAQKACSFSEITIVSQFGTMPYDCSPRKCCRLSTTWRRRFKPPCFQLQKRN